MCKGEKVTSGFVIHNLNLRFKTYLLASPNNLYLQIFSQKKLENSVSDNMF